MAKVLRGLALVVALSGFGGLALSVAPAQDKKADKKGDKKADMKEGKTTGGTIEVSEGKDGKYRFSVRDADGKYVGGSAVGHATREEAVKAVDTLKAVIITAKVTAGTKGEKEKETDKEKEKSK